MLEDSISEVVIITLVDLDMKNENQIRKNCPKWET